MNFKLKLPSLRTIDGKGRKLLNVKTYLKILQLQNMWYPSRNGMETS